MLLLLIIIFLCWGSFLNVVAYRLIREESIVFPRSSCPQCRKLIAWYDNIPVFSWLFLCGKCRRCKQPISYLYPFIEIFTAISLTALWFSVPMHYFPLYFTFFSALIVTIRSDIETMLISRYVTICLIPVGVVGSFLGMLPITMRESMLGCMLGYLVLYLTALIFQRCSGKDGLGQGDLDLLACIGAFVGPLGCWVTLLAGSLLGSCMGILYLAIKRPLDKKIPFGPFLAIGGIVYVLFSQKIVPIF